MSYEIIFKCNSTNNKNVREGELVILRKFPKQLYFEFGESKNNIKKRYYNDLETLNADFEKLLKLQKQESKKEKEENKENKEKNEQLKEIEDINNDLDEILKTVKKEEDKPIKKSSKKKITRK